MSLALALLFAAAGFSQDLKTVCANAPFDSLPAGVVFGASDAFLAKARDQVAKAPSSMERSPYAGAGQPPDWLKATYELDDGEIQFPASLVCEVASARQDAQHPYALVERQHITIGALQNLLFETLPLQIRTETDPKKCAALP